MLKLGDKVKWVSQSQGWQTIKIGEIIWILPSGEPLPWRRFDGSHKLMDGGGNSRNEVSYLIEVKIGPKVKPRLYWPRVSHLHKVDNG